jgi:hypothetical protein
MRANGSISFDDRQVAADRAPSALDVRFPPIADEMVTAKSEAMGENRK